MRLIGFWLLVCPAFLLAGETNVMKRGTLENARIQFQNGKKGHVAFIGGSITEMNGYRPMVCEMLTNRFPECQFTFTDAGIASTCSTTGAFRLQDDVLGKGPLDLFFIEFAVNDDQDAHHTRDECIRGMEGLVRHVRRHNPRADIVITYFVNEHMMAQYRKQETPLPIAAHEAVAEHYQIPTIHLAREVTMRIDAGEFDWKKFGGVHPAPFGNRIAADMIGKLFETCWVGELPAGAAMKDHSLPPKPFDPANYEFGRFLPLRDAKASPQWKIHVPEWSKLPGSKRDRFTRIDMLEATEPGASLTCEFKGTAIGAYLVAGPDAGKVEVRIDGGEPKTIDLYHGFSAGLHYPRTVMFGDALMPGKHTLDLRLLAEKNPASKGTAMRAMHFVANGD
jgi:lysophospholipase L1-like esterase